MTMGENNYYYCYYLDLIGGFETVEKGVLVNVAMDGSVSTQGRFD